MSAATWVGVAVLGGTGAVLRFLLADAIAAWSRSSFPLGILVVNLSGAFVLGVLAEALESPVALELLGIGLLGSYTTFSAWMLESERELTQGERRAGLANLLVSLVAGLALAWLGTKVGAAL